MAGSDFGSDQEPQQEEAHKLDVGHETPQANDPQVDDLFTNLTPAFLHDKPKPQQRPRQHRTFDMTVLRRSVRLSKNPAMPAIERAQLNIWSKLGLNDNEFALAE